MDTFADLDFPNMLGKTVSFLKTWYTGWDVWGNEVESEIEL